MTKQQILKKLSDATLDDITREQLNQHLHHIIAQAKLKGPAANKHTKHTTHKQQRR
jgi:hypothetical protein